jgi:hypothetical protein
VIQTIQLGVPVARIELLDEVQMDAVNRHSKLTLPGRADAVLRVPRLTEQDVRSRPNCRGRSPPRTAA